MIFTPPGPGEAPIILDGGLGTHLERRGNDISGALWSAQILKDRPQEVRAAHADFFAAGAQVATTCSYQVTFEGSGEETTALLRASVRRARAAAEEAAGRGGGPRWVAASVGPYGAGPGPGTEYDGAYGKDERELARWHGPRAEALAAAGPDLLLAETIPSLPEVAALSVALRGLGLCALGVNCCSAREATAALGILRRHTDLPLLAYPNSGERWDAAARRWVATPEEPAALRIDAPVALIGGCCRVGPEEIARVARRWAGGDRR